MSQSKSKCWYSNNCLHFFKARCSIVENCFVILKLVFALHFLIKILYSPLTIDIYIYGLELKTILPFMAFLQTYPKGIETFYFPHSFLNLIMRHGSLTQGPQATDIYAQVN